MATIMQNHWENSAKTADNGWRVNLAHCDKQKMSMLLYLFLHCTLLLISDINYFIAHDVLHPFLIIVSVETDGCTREIYIVDI